MGCMESFSPSSSETCAWAICSWFLNRRRNRIKLMYWDRDGLAIWMKRLERGTFQRPQQPTDARHVEMDATDLTLLLSGIELTTVKRRPRYLFVSATHRSLDQSRS